MAGSAVIEPGVRSRPPALGILVFVALFCGAIQIASATWIVPDFESPNAAAVLARNLVREGRLSVPAGERQLLMSRERRAEPLRAFLLPGEPLLLAAAFAAFPVPLHRYVHVPVTVLFVTAVCAVAFIVAGRGAAIAAGALASLDPFVVVHGPVWDDTFLAAALEWTCLAAIAYSLAQPARVGRWPMGLAVPVLAAAAALTRFQSQLDLAILGLLLMWSAWAGRTSSRRSVPQRVWGLGVALLFGVTAALVGWGARNAAVLGTFLVTTTHEGQVLWQSNHARARESILQWGLTQALVPQLIDPGGSEIAVDRAMRREALVYLRSHPVDAAQTGLLKVGVSVFGIDFGTRRQLRNLVAAASSGGVLVLAVVGYREPPAAIAAGSCRMAAATRGSGDRRRDRCAAVRWSRRHAISHRRDRLRLLPRRDRHRQPRVALVSPEPSVRGGVAARTATGRHGRPSTLRAPPLPPPPQSA